MTPWVTRLIVANVIMYVLTAVLVVVPVRRLILVPILVPYQPWTLITYMFLHAGIGHLLFNMLGLFFFGPRLEARLGGRQFLWLYFLSGLMGAVLSIFTPLAQIVGASGAVYGVLLGFARYWPREPIYIWGIFPIEARVLVVILTALILLGGFGGTQAGVAHFAHLGGFVGGFVYLKWLEGRSPAKKWRQKVAASTRKSGGDGADLKRWKKINRDDLHEVNRVELDRVLEKLTSNGVGSLTSDERAFLDRFSSD